MPQITIKYYCCFTGYKLIEKALDHICSALGGEILDISAFSKELTDISVYVTCYEDRFMRDGIGKPVKYIRYDKGKAEMWLPMSFDEVEKADDETRLLMVLKNIVDSVNIIGERIPPEKLDGIHGSLTDAEYKELMSK